MAALIADEFGSIGSRMRQILAEREAGQRYAGLSREVREELSRLLRGEISQGSRSLDDWFAEAIENA